MTEQQRNTILSRWRAGASLRRIARELHLARRTVQRVVSGVEAQRAGLQVPRPTRWMPTRACSTSCWHAIPT